MTMRSTVTPRLTSFRTYVVLPPDSIYYKPSAPIRAYGAEDVFELLNYHDQELTLGHLVEIRKQSAVEEAEEPEPDPKERAMTVLNLTEGLGVTEAGIKVFEDTDRKELRALTTGHGTRGLLVGYEEVLKKKKRSLSLQTSALPAFKKPSESRASPPALLDS
jgi:cysteine synthase